MATQKGPGITLPDPLHMSRTVARLAEQSQQLVNNFLKTEVAEGPLGLADMSSVGNAFLEMTCQMLSNPLKLVEAQRALWRSHIDFWQESAAFFLEQRPQRSAAPERLDPRFEHRDWQDNYLLYFIKQSYLLTARWLQATVGELEGVDDKTKKKLSFYTRQFVDALAPTNFPITNPEVLRATVESGGENLLRGLSNLLEDLAQGKGKLGIPRPNPDAFKLGENIAATPAKVIFQNELMQLLQYEPMTEKVFRIPLLVVPPWINKFYIFDLGKESSLIGWWVEQGFTVFAISWVNPAAESADKPFEEYLLEGPLAALQAIEKATGEQQVNAVGYRLGGTLLACAVAYLAATGDNRIRSATYVSTMLDFAHPGELEMFINEEQISAFENRVQDKDLSASAAMTVTHKMLRANDLIWSFFVNSYLLGKERFPFDLLYWNSDIARVPEAMHGFYLRNMYQRNLLREAGGISLAGQSIDLGKSAAPAYFLSSIEDHITPWKSTYEGARLQSAPVRFALEGCGYSTGIINPPTAGRHCYWANSGVSANSEDWLAGTERKEGSCWSDWREWIDAHAGDKAAARKPGTGELLVIEDGPGSYVKVQSGR